MTSDRKLRSALKIAQKALNKTATSLSILLLMSGCAAPDYGAREMPKQPPGMSDDDYWKMLKKERWF